MSIAMISPETKYRRLLEIVSYLCLFYPCAHKVQVRNVKKIKVKFVTKKILFHQTG
jgi:hypothetical protein